MKTFITCYTPNVVYLLTCPCGFQYNGSTIRLLQVRINEHIGNIKRGFKGHPVSRHYLEVHKKIRLVPTFLELIRLNCTGGVDQGDMKSQNLKLSIGLIVSDHWVWMQMWRWTFIAHAWCILIRNLQGNFTIY